MKRRRPYARVNAQKVRRTSTDLETGEGLQQTLLRCARPVGLAAADMKYRSAGSSCFLTVAPVDDREVDIERGGAGHVSRMKRHNGTVDERVITRAQRYRHSWNIVASCDPSTMLRHDR